MGGPPGRHMVVPHGRATWAAQVARRVFRHLALSVGDSVIGRCTGGGECGGAGGSQVRNSRTTLDARAEQPGVYFHFFRTHMISQHRLSKVSKVSKNYTQELGCVVGVVASF